MYHLGDLVSGLAFHDLAEELYDIDLTRYFRGVTSEDASGVELINGQEKLQDLVTNHDSEAHNGKVIQTATHLTGILAEHLAVTIAWLMRSILDHASKILFDNDIQPLLTTSFWILPLYRELLNSARRIRPSAASEGSWLHRIGQAHR